jgi:hypothetical protein
MIAEEAFVDATYKTNKVGYELYVIIVEKNFESLPISYLLLDTRRKSASKAEKTEKTKEKKTENLADPSISVERRGKVLAQWFQALRSRGFKPKIMFTDKDMAEVDAIRTVWGPDGTQVKLCLWHTLTAIRKKLLANPKKPRNPPNPAPPNPAPPNPAPPNPALPIVTQQPANKAFSDRQISRENVSDYLWSEIGLPHIQAWILRGRTDPSTKPLCTKEEAAAVSGMCRRHFLLHPLLPYTFWNENQQVQVIADTNSSPQFLHFAAVMEMLATCMRMENPGLFRYLWANWYRSESEQYDERWKWISISTVSGWVPRSRTTMRVENHWRILKRHYLYQFNRPRIDLLLFVIQTAFMEGRLRKWELSLKFRSKPSWYKEFKRDWKRSWTIGNKNVEATRLGIQTYRTDVIKWTCGCRFFQERPRKVCKHLLIQKPCSETKPWPEIPKYNPAAFQKSPPFLCFGLPAASDALTDLPPVVAIHEIAEDLGLDLLADLTLAEDDNVDAQEEGDDSDIEARFVRTREGNPLTTEESEDQPDSYPPLYKDFVEMVNQSVGNPKHMRELASTFLGSSQGRSTVQSWKDERNRYRRQPTTHQPVPRGSQYDS